MHKSLAAALTCLTLFCAPAYAQSDGTVLDRAMADLDLLFERGAPIEEISRQIETTLNTAKASGVIDPDLAIFYAMLADYLRLEADNPAYALQIAEDGLALIAGNPAQADFQAALMASRAYALADLGQFAQAYETLTLAIPALSQSFDEDTIADYRAHADQWAQGQLTDFNRSALDIARETLAAAYEARDQGAHGRVLVLAGSALLPMDTSFAESDLRAVNIESEKLTAEALFSLGRHRESANAYLRALGYGTVTPWQLQGTPDWWGTVTAGTDVGDTLFEILEGLATSASGFGRPDVESAALSAAYTLAASPRQRYILLQRQARISAANGRLTDALAQLQQSVDIARAAELDSDVIVGEFYVAMIRIYEQLVAGERFDEAPFIAATDRVLTTLEQQNIPGRDFFLYSAANVLRHGNVPEKTLEYARQALHWRQADLARKSDTGFGATQGRRASRDTLELFLHAAHTAASATPHPGQRVEACPDDDAYTSCLIVMPTD